MAETSAGLGLNLCLRAPDGIVVFDVCPTREIAEATAASPEFADLCRRHGLPEPEQPEQFPVHAAIVEGRTREALSAGAAAPR